LGGTGIGSEETLDLDKYRGPASGRIAGIRSIGAAVAWLGVACQIARIQCSRRPGDSDQQLRGSVALSDNGGA